MPQLNPGESFPIIRALSDPNDVATNYVQAIVVDAVTDATIATINLTDKGSQRFKNVWQVPSDNVFGRGRFITITTTVYTDSGHTSLNANYAKQTDTYLIQQRMDLRFMPGGGMNTDDYRKVLLEGLATLKFPEAKSFEIPKPVDYTGHLEAINGRLHDLGVQIGGIPTPDKPDKVDLSSIHQAIANLHEYVRTLPRFQETDQSGVLNALDQIHTAIALHSQASVQAHKATQETVTDQVVPILEKTAHENVIQGIRDGSINISLNKSPEEKQKDSTLKRLAARYAKT